MDSIVLRLTNLIARNAFGKTLKSEGKFDFQVCYDGQQITANCLVTSQSDLDLLGVDCLDELKLLKQITHFLGLRSSVVAGICTIYKPISRPEGGKRKFVFL